MRRAVSSVYPLCEASVEDNVLIILLLPLQLIFQKQRENRADERDHKRADQRAPPFGGEADAQVGADQSGEPEQHGVDQQGEQAKGGDVK